MIEYGGAHLLDAFDRSVLRAPAARARTRPKSANLPSGIARMVVADAHLHIRPVLYGAVHGRDGQVQRGVHADDLGLLRAFMKRAREKERVQNRFAYEIERGGEHFGGEVFLSLRAKGVSSSMK